MRRCVVSVRANEVACISRGRYMSRRAVRIDSARGINANMRRLINHSQSLIQIKKVSQRFRGINSSHVDLVLGILYYKIRNSPNSFAPGWRLFCFCVPHEAPGKSPYRRYEKSRWDKNRSSNHDWLHEDTQQKDVHVCDDGT